MVNIPNKAHDGNPPNMGFLVKYVCDTLIKGGRKDMFVVDGRVCVFDCSSKYSLKSCRRPGILVLINDADWELEGEDSYVINIGDNILFVSTLHGG